MTFQTNDKKIVQLMVKSNAQCSYREGHAYIVKNPMVCLKGPTTKFL